jgi:mannosyltransferase OCH1-like enzyme
MEYLLITLVVLLGIVLVYTNSMRIPKIIHQTAPSDTSKWNPIWFECQKSWKKLHPDFTYMFWSDEDIEDFMQKEYPEFYNNVFSSYDVKIKKIDASRYFILYHYGGIYADMDYKCQKRFFEDIPQFNVSIAESRVEFDEGYQNALMASPKGDRFWNTMFQNLEKNKNETNVLMCTGPVMISRSIKETGNKVNPLISKDYNPYFDHYTDSPDNYKNAKCIHMHTYSWYSDDKKSKI